jgi:hypothetical protein
MIREAGIGRLLYVRLDYLLFASESAFWLLAKAMEVRDHPDTKVR